MKQVIVALLIAWLLVSCQNSGINSAEQAPAPREFQGKPSVSIGNHHFLVELARTQAEHTRGLSGHAPLSTSQGMLFIFPGESVRNFWMKDMLFALDIVFIDAKRTVVDIKREFQPCTPQSCPTYTSSGPAMFVLEVNAGLLSDVQSGDLIEFHNID